MATQTQKGKAFEYACLKALNEKLGEQQEVHIDSTEAYETAKEFYGELDLEAAEKMDSGAKAAVRIIRRLEPLLDNPDDDTPLYLAIQEDAKGIAGDVRDVVCIRKKNGWEINPR